MDGLMDLTQELIKTVLTEMSAADADRMQRELEDTRLWQRGIGHVCRSLGALGGAAHEDRKRGSGFLTRRLRELCVPHTRDLATACLLAGWWYAHPGQRYPDGEYGYVRSGATSGPTCSPRAIQLCPANQRQVILR
jgi:hypothetical protein